MYRGVYIIQQTVPIALAPYYNVLVRWYFRRGVLYDIMRPNRYQHHCDYWRRKQRRRSSGALKHNTYIYMRIIIINKFITKPYVLYGNNTTHNIIHCIFSKYA